MKKIIIYQIKDIENTDYAFRSFDEKKFNINDYEKVCGIETNKYNDLINADVAEAIFTASNIGVLRIPEAHTISVSDIIKVDDDYFYCDIIGWKTVTKYAT